MLLRTRIILGVMAGIMLVIIGLVAGRLYADSQSEARYQDLAINDQRVLWQKIVEGQIGAIEAGISGLTRNRQAMQALAELDQNALREAAKGVFNRLSTQKIITRLHLTDRSGRIVYSSIDRLSEISSMAQLALDRGEIVGGLYQDVDGAIQVAVATPLFHRGKPAGVGLLMREVGAALADLQGSLSSEVAIFNGNGQRFVETDAAFLIGPSREVRRSCRAGENGNYSLTSVA